MRKPLYLANTLLLTALLGSPANAMDCGCDPKLTDLEGVCSKYTSMAVGSLQIVARNDRVTKVTFTPETIIFGEDKVTRTFYVENTDCSPSIGPDNEMLVAWNAETTRLTYCNASHLDQSGIRIPGYHRYEACKNWNDA